MQRDRRYYDISREIFSDLPVWPGDAEFQLLWSARIADGDPTNLGSVALGLHTATHVDAPFHTLDSGASIGDLPLDPFIGSAHVVEAAGHVSIGADFIDRILSRGRVERLLLRTCAWREGSVFPSKFPFLEPAAAECLASAGVTLIGTDAPSVDPFTSTQLESHRVFAAAGIVILENLDLDEVPEGEYQLIALPLRLRDADASPVRAVLYAP
jgi:arylformamidase